MVLLQHFAQKRMLCTQQTSMTQCNHSFAKKPALMRKWNYEVVLKKRPEILSH